MTTESGVPASGYEPRCSPPNRLCLCDWVLKDHGQQVAPVRVRQHPGCPVDHRSGGVLIRKP